MTASVRARISVGHRTIPPRYAVSCFGGAWDRPSYNYDGITANGDAPRTFPAVQSFGDGKPEAPFEPGHIIVASQGNDGTQPGDIGIGSTFSLAYSSGTNPSIPATASAAARHSRLFAAAYVKRITRFGPGGPGAIYEIDTATGSERLYTWLQDVIPGPDGYPYDPGDGSSGTFPSEAYGVGYSMEMGGLHTFGHDDLILPYIGTTGFGGMALDSNEHYLQVLNLRNRTVYTFDTWSATTPPPRWPLALDANVAACPGGTNDFRPFAIQYQPDAGGTDWGYAGYVCSGETRQLRSDLRAGVIRWGTTAPVVQARVLDFALDAFDAQRANKVETIWRPWNNSLYVQNSQANQQPMLTDLEFAEDGSLLLGLRSRTGDMATTDRWPAAFVSGQGDLLRATPNGSGGWNAPSSAVPELYNDVETVFNGLSYEEAAWGGIAYVPGTHAGGYGGEVVTSAAMPFRNYTSGAYWFDLSGGSPTAKEELYGPELQTQFKGSGLGDMELLCVWRAIGNRVWRDTNSNGVQDAGEPDIGGVRLQLLDSSGSTVLATVTTGTISGAGDLYRFYVAPYQDYRVRIDPAMYSAGQPLYGLSPTAANQGGDTVDSDADGNGVIVIPAGPRSNINLSFDFGLADGGNIRVTKSGPGTALPGSTIAYTIVVSNDGPGTARSVSVVDTLPAGVSYASASPAPASVSGSTITWNVGDMSAGASLTITLNATIGTGTRGSITNSVTITTSSGGDSPGDNTSTSTGTIITPNVRVFKSGPATVLPDGTLAYTLSYDNNGTAAAAGVQIVDTLPAGVTFVSASPAPASVSGNTITWSAGSVSAGGGGTISVTAQASASVARGATLTNSASISTTTSGDSPGDNTSTSTTTVIAPNVRMSKSGPATVLPDGTLAYTLSYDNNGTAAAAGVQIVDTLPAGVTFVSASPAPASVSGNTITWNIGTLNAGASGTISVTAQASASAARGTTFTNSGSISTTTSGDSPGDNTSTSTTTVVAPNVRASKTGPARVIAGDQLSYTLSYDNNGDAAAAGVQIVDTLPAGVTFVSATPAPASVSGSTLTWDIGTLNAGASGTITVVAQTAPTLADGATITNGASISTTTTGDDPGDNDSSWDTRVDRADVAIVKSSPTTFPVSTGATVTYYLDYSNNGPALARNVVVTDTVPSQMASVTWSCTSGCSASGSGNAISVSLGTLAAGASGRIAITGVATTTTAREDFTNTATISTDTPETTTSNNSSSVPGAVWTSDLLIIKDADPLAAAGGPFNVTLTVRNQGPAAATSVQVVDTLPAGATFVSATPAPASVSGSTITWNLGTINDLGEQVIALTLRADAALDGGTSLLNSATTSGGADRDASNNTDTATTIVQRRADLSIAKTGPARVTAGEPIAYTLAYANDGPSKARAVRLTDTLPSGVTFVSATPAPASVSGSTLTWNLGDLTPGQSGVINVTVATEAAQIVDHITVINQTTITDGGTDAPGGGGINDDPDPGDNDDSTTTDIETSDVVITKDMPAFAVAGVPFDATIRVENRGPADAVSVSVRDFLPPTMTLISATPATSGPGRWSLGTLAAGQVVTITLHVSVPSTTPRDALFVNRAIVDTLTPDRDESNNITEDSTTIRPNADLAVSKDGPAGPILSGSVVTYTLDWKNLGPSQATTVILTDTLPAGFTFQQATPAPSSVTGATLTWELGAQDVGASGTVEVIGTLVTSQASETRVNTATIGSETDDPTLGNNTDTVSTVVQTVDLAIVKAGDPAGARAGEVYTYTLTLTNAGAAPATSVVVSDTLPSGVVFSDATPLPATRDGQALTWNLGGVPAGGTRQITLLVEVAPSARGTLTNTATVGSPDPDRAPDNNTSTHTTGITAEADLSLTKDGPTGPIRSGSVVTYTLRYHNHGPALAEAAVVTDTLPAGFTFQQATPAPSGVAGATLTWALGDLDAGNSGLITLHGTLLGAGVTADVVNTAAISSTTDDPAPDDNQDSHTLTVLKPDLRIHKGNGVDRVQPGDLLTYQIVVTNTGTITATGVRVAETPPSGAVLDGNGWGAGVGGVYTQAIGALDAGEVVTLTLRVQLANPLPAGMDRALNIAVVTDDGSAGDDPTPEDSSTQDDDPVIAGAVGDLIWIDRNRNGEADPGEPGLGDVPLDLLDPVTGATLAHTVTDSTGGYRFDGLRLGDYAIQIDPSTLGGRLDGYFITTDPIPVTALTSAQREDMSLDIGLYSPTAAVTLVYFRAERQPNGTIQVRWGTIDERDTKFFTIKRTTTPNLTDAAVRIGSLLSKGSAGGDYVVVDPTPPSGVAYYWLIETETSGATHSYGSASPHALAADPTRVYLPLIIR